VTSLEEAIEELPGRARARLAAFAAAFENLEARHYALFATKPESPQAVERAMAAANAALTGDRRDAVRSVIRAFTDAAAFNYSNRLALPDTLLLFQSLTDTAADRTRVMQSLERVIVGLVLWDELEDDDTPALIGPWAEVVARALGPSDGDAG
jgi:hypothetical protein